VPDLVGDRIGEHPRDVLFARVCDPENAVVEGECRTGVLVPVAEGRSHQNR
jgi:hypothetical protein